MTAAPRFGLREAVPLALSGDMPHCIGINPIDPRMDSSIKAHPFGRRGRKASGLPQIIARW